MFLTWNIIRLERKLFVSSNILVQFQFYFIRLVLVEGVIIKLEFFGADHDFHFDLTKRVDCVFKLLNLTVMELFYHGLQNSGSIILRNAGTKHFTVEFHIELEFLI